MFEILLTACLAGAPTDCRTERLPGGETLSACREAARIGAEGFHPQFSVQDFPCVPAGKTPAFTVTEIAQGVFVHKGMHDIPNPVNRGDISNMGFIIGPASVMIIDTGATHQIGATLLEAVRAETDLPVSHVVLTHVHPDHVYGTGALTEGNVEIIAHHRMGAALQNRAENYNEAMGRLLGSAFDGSEPVQPNREISEIIVIELGAGREIELRPHPTSHTDSDLTVFDRASGTLFAGDLVFDGHIPALDGSITGWIETTRTLKSMPGGIRVVPGHGPVTMAWDTAFDGTGRYLDLLAKDTRDALRRGVPMLQAIREIAGDAEARWLLFDEFNARNATAAFKELEWE